MECFNCLKCCECGYFTKSDEGVIHSFCSQSCTNAFMIDKLLEDIDKRITLCKKNIKKANHNLTIEPENEQWMLVKRCHFAELMFSNALLKRKSKAELQQLAELIRNAMVDRLQHITDSGDSKFMMSYADYMKARHFDYDISLLGK